MRVAKTEGLSLFLTYEEAGELMSFLMGGVDFDSHPLASDIWDALEEADVKDPELSITHPH
jgi:hypothetical protein